MKIAVLSSGLGHVARGVEAWADSLSAELYGRGVDVRLFKGGGRPERPFERVICCARRDRGVARFLKSISPRFGWRFGFGSTYQIEQTTFALSAILRLWLGRFHLAHTQDPWLALLLERTRKFHGAKVILAHGTEEDFSFLLNFRHVQELVPRYLEDDRKKGLPADRLWFAIPNFVDCEAFSPGERDKAREKFDIPKDKFVVLDVAALKFSHKRLEHLIKEAAFLRRRYPQLFLVMAGALTPDTEKLRGLADSALGEGYRLFVNIDKGKMPEIYRAADIFAHPALFEMMPLALLEALASGLPVVSHKNHTYEWIVGPGGSRVDMEQPGGLAQEIGKFINDPEFLAQSSRAARKQAVDNFARVKIVDQILAMYEKVSGR